MRGYDCTGALGPAITRYGDVWVGGEQLELTIQRIESCTTIDRLSECLNGAISSYGFCAFSFVDAGQPHLDEPFCISTTGDSWEKDYRSNGFVRVDPCLSQSRRANWAFTWKDVEMPQRLGKRKPGAHLLMEAANDYGFFDGYVFPFHYVDHLSRTHSAVVGLFWSDEHQEIDKSITGTRRFELELIISYWMHRTIDIVSLERNKESRFGNSFDESGLQPSLTDRERDVLSWAGRGLTALDTAEVLTLSIETIRTHLSHAARKLGANNKTHAVTLAMHHSLIDL